MIGILNSNSTPNINNNKTATHLINLSTNEMSEDLRSIMKIIFMIIKHSNLLTFELDTIKLRIATLLNNIIYTRKFRTQVLTKEEKIEEQNILKLLLLIGKLIKNHDNKFLHVLNNIEQEQSQLILKHNKLIEDTYKVKVKK